MVFFGTSTKVTFGIGKLAHPNSLEWLTFQLPDPSRVHERLPGRVVVPGPGITAAQVSFPHNCLPACPVILQWDRVPYLL